ncbi:pyridoxal-phosphate dependent enzyme [Lysobacter tyrosinilyticus]
MTLLRHELPEFARLWDDYRPTRLIELPELARLTDVGRVFVKLECERPFGNFKVLGGMIAGLRALARVVGAASPIDLLEARDDRHALPALLCASDGNHGLAVAAAAQRAGTAACIYLPVGVDPVRAARIEALGGRIVWIDDTYDAAVLAAVSAAQRGEGLLIPDTTADSDDVVVRDVMAGYSLITTELADQLAPLRTRPSHVFAQAGVGGLAAALADGLRDLLRSPARIVVVEPESAACVARALQAGHPVQVTGDLHSSAQMLSCGLVSTPALHTLQRHDARAVLVDEDQLARAVTGLRAAGGPDTTPSGAAGLAGLLTTAARPDLRSALQLTSGSDVLLVVTEGTTPNHDAATFA